MKSRGTMIVLAVMIVAAFALTSCGGGKATEIKIGGISPLTGEAATFGQSTKNGMELAVEEWNAAGGVLGKQVKLIVEDDKGDPAEGAAVFSKLIEQDKVVAIVGGITSRVALAGAPIAQAAKVPMVTPTATNEKVTQVGDYIFRSCFIDPFQGSVMAKFAVQDLGILNAGVIFDLGNDYSKGLAETFSASLTSLGGQVLASEGYPSGATDFKAQLTKIVQAKPEAVYIPAYYNDVGLIAKQIRELGYEGKLLGCDGWDSSELVNIGGTAVDGGFFTNHYSKDDTRPVVQDIVRKYSAKYGAPPDALAVLAYDGMNILLDAVKRAGKTNNEAIRDALKTTDLACVGGQIRYDENRNPVKSVVIIEMKDGQQVYRATVEP
ncbi:MAG: ABC transporter substrate-binding protein [bacterium]|jgi:branched-chain amino acid transport system substrate-binding protein|uniref:Branched-chain amino acid ABC transporter substrate-binding protein n=1 Tax=uncultured Spirochaetota bacterium TaxID=460511 RepID=A0A652ZYC4_9SPIR|nr:Branched-chain amino acid ABC transporter substrate-binding protein [uncultured Spirochaetota bacterium]HOI21865.1 ABC transporter substrate-binding protein [Spirochaetales bacterium]